MRAAASHSVHAPSHPRKAYIVGGHITKFIGKGHPDFVHKKHPDFGKRANPEIKDYIFDSVRGALKNTGVPAGKIQKAWIGNFVGSLFVQQAHLGAALVGADEALRFIPSMRVEGACASGGLAFASAFEAIQAGTDVTLVAGAEVQTTASPREGGDYLARAADYKRQRHLDDFTFPALFAQRLQAYTKKYNVDPKDVARIAVKAYSNANKNPLAHMWKAKMDFETATATSDKNPAFLANVSDGGAALVMVSEAGLKALGKSVADAVEVLTVQVATDNLYKDGALEAFETTKAAAQRAYAVTGLGPKAIQVAEVHDCFTIAEVLMYEALGFAAPGQGVSLIKNGTTTLEGALPVNTGGGLIGFGHPVGATGVKQVLEIVKQLRGEAGAYQVKNAPSVGLTANMGGSDKTAVVSILRKGGAPRAAL